MSPPFAPGGRKRHSLGARVRCVLKRRWCRIVANGLPSCYDYFEVGSVISSRSSRENTSRRSELRQRVCRAPAQNRFGPHRVEPVGRGFVQPRCI